MVFDSETVAAPVRPPYPRSTYTFLAVSYDRCGNTPPASAPAAAPPLPAPRVR